jgi:energy-coupling factor transporter ATP-binding protein EcfA2
MPMIRKVTLRNFKRFDDITFTLAGHVVLAGPNNTGKTTLLQAVAAWALAYGKWRELNDFNPRRNGYAWQDLERLAFSAVSLRSFDLLWRNRQRSAPLEIGLQVDGVAMLTLEFRFRAAGQMQVHPKSDCTSDVVSHPAYRLQTTFVPAMAGLAREEMRLADPEAIRYLLAQGRPGEVLRNLLVSVHRDQPAWQALNATVYRMFGASLLPPVPGAPLECEYQQAPPEKLPVAGLPRLDIASAGSGFLQVLLVLSLMLTQGEQGAHQVLLIDEPDAHLHLLLQKTIYDELRSVAAQRKAQLLVATHSEQVIESADPHELYLMYGQPRKVSDAGERALLMHSLGALTHSEVLAANGAAGVLYAEDATDFAILDAFARVLGDDDALRLLTVTLVRKRSRAPVPEGLGEVQPARHWEMLKLVNPALPAVELLDGDAKNEGQQSITGSAEKMQRARWRYYEIESYLLSPGPWQRFLKAKLGEGAAADQATSAAFQEMDRLLEATYRQHPLLPTPPQQRVLETEPASKTLIPAMLQAAGLNQFNKSSYFEIAQHFQPEEVHPEVRHKLALLKFAFGAGEDPGPYEAFADA